MESHIEPSRLVELRRARAGSVPPVLQGAVAEHWFNGDRLHLVLRDSDYANHMTVRASVQGANANVDRGTLVRIEGAFVPGKRLWVGQTACVIEVASGHRTCSTM